jgi:protein gp37
VSENSKIEWTDHTFNPWEGCQKVGPGCDHCYAETRNARYGGGVAVNWGPGAPRRRTSEANWRKPLAWNRSADAFYSEHGRRQRVFCASLADVFDNEVEPAWRADLFALIAATPNLDWLLLTKRIGNAEPMIDEALKTLWNTTGALGPSRWPWANVWLGATVVNQAEADRDIPKLLATPASLRFLSIEPMLGPISLRWLAAFPENAPTTAQKPGDDTDHLDGLRRLDWVIAGGESGPGARPAHPEWFSALRDQCEQARVPYLFKQWGEWLPVNQHDEEFTHRLYRSNRKAKLHQDQGRLDDCYGRTCTVDQACIQGDGAALAPLAPMAFLQGMNPMLTFRVGKKAAGRLLDGVEHSGFPRSFA